MIFENLRPYEAAGISEAAIMAGFAQCHDPLLIRITGHAVNATLAGGRPGRAGRHHWYIDLFRRLAPHLGDTLLVLNMQDEPCSWTAPLPAPAQAAYSAGALGLEAAWLAHGCDGAGLRRLRQLHGFFVSPLTFPATREPTPVWSLYSLPACFGGGPFESGAEGGGHFLMPRPRSEPAGSALATAAGPLELLWGADAVSEGALLCRHTDAKRRRPAPGARRARVPAARHRPPRGQGDPPAAAAAAPAQRPPSALECPALMRFGGVQNQTAIFRGSSSGGYAGPNHTQGECTHQAPRGGG